MTWQERVREAITRGQEEFLKNIELENTKRKLQHTEGKKTGDQDLVILSSFKPQAEQVEEHIKAIIKETGAIRATLYFEGKKVLIPWLEGRVQEKCKDIRNKIHSSYLVESLTEEEFYGYKWSLYSKSEYTSRIDVYLTAGLDLFPLYILKNIHGSFKAFANPENLFAALLKFVEKAIAEYGTTPRC